MSDSGEPTNECPDETYIAARISPTIDDQAKPLPSSTVAHEAQRNDGINSVLGKEVQGSSVCTGRNAMYEQVAEWPTEPEVRHLMEMFAKASIADPEVRLVLSYSPAPRFECTTMSTGVPLPYTSICGWSMASVAQRAQDVDFSFSIPFLDGASTPAHPGGSSQRIQCKIVYDPRRDSCILFNVGHYPFYVGHVKRRTKTHLCNGNHKRLTPDHWRIYAAVQADGKDGLQVLVDLQVLPRRFHVSVYVDSTVLSTKRRRPTTRELPPAKRTKVAEKENMGASQKPAGLCTEQELASTAAQTEVAALTELQTEQVAEISTLPVRKRRKNEIPSDGALYRLTRTGTVAVNNCTVVFTCRHSGLREKGDVVAKVLRDKRPAKKAGDAAGTVGGARSIPANVLEYRARLWKNELDVLKRLRHVSFVFFGVPATFVAPLTSRAG